MRDGAVFEAVEEGDRAACLQDVEEDRRNERRRDYVCAVVCSDFGDSVFVQVLHCRELYGIFVQPMAEYLALLQRYYLYLSCTFM